MPSSRALVAASPSSSPVAQRAARARGAPRAGSRRGRPPPGPAATGSTSASRPAAVSATCSAPRRERTKARVRTPSTDQVGQQVGGLRRRRRGVRARRSRRRSDVKRRLPQRERDLARGASRRRSTASDVEPGQPRGVHLGLGRPSPRPARTSGRRRSARADPSQPAQHLGDVGAEDAAVVVALVDHDVVAASPRNARPARRAAAAASGGACRGW